METSLRWILLLFGIIIVAGIFWDAKRGKKQSRQSVTSLRREQRLEEDDDSDVEHFSEALDDLDNPENLFEEVKAVREPTVRSVSALEQTKTQKLSHSVSPVAEMVAITVMARHSGTFLGKQILEAFQEVYLHYGERQIFHRYENQDGTGQKMFSVVSAIEPGYFDLSKIDALKTPGIILFFTLTRPNQSIAAFETMLRTAKLLAMRLDGELKDERRGLLTSQRIEQYRERVRSPQLQMA
jgi:cell division protein ZipA